MNLEITLQNYRCFSSAEPATFSISDGFTSFVGLNNSGKSSVLRSLFELRPIFVDIVNQFDKYFGQAHVADVQLGHFPWNASSLFHNQNDDPIVVSIIQHNGTDTSAPPIGLQITVFRQLHIRCRPIFGTAVQDSYERHHGSHLTLNNGFVVSYNFLRTLLQTLGNCMYIGASRLGPGSGTTHFDVTVGQDLVAMWRRLKEEKLPDAVRRIATIQRTLGRIFGVTELEVIPVNDNRLFTVIMDGHPYSFYEIGSGFGEFFVLFANVAQRKPSFVLIDEPESHLHPALQVDLLKNLLALSTAGVVAFSTHSFGLARSVSSRTYAVNRSNNQSQVQLITSSLPLPSLLGELSYASYGYNGSSRVLLVEGVSDVLMMRELLRLYGKDRDTAIIPLGGTNMINGTRKAELALLKNLSDNISAVVDSERSSTESGVLPRIEEFAATARELNIRVCVLSRRASENYLSDVAVKKAFGPKYSSLDEFQRPNALNHFWGKTRNWEAAVHMTKGELDNTDLGRFLAQI
jgi:ABC-type cobalamin/Fe3+-siderophores transport system ATPase subunit